MSVEHLDVLIVGAGIPGIGAGYFLQDRCRSRRYAILEGRDDPGGAWSLFRYPGVRSDSDMFALGCSFRPWTEDRATADGPAILSCLREAAREFGIDRHIRFRQRVRSASWSSEQARWTVEAEVGRAGSRSAYRAISSISAAATTTMTRATCPPSPAARRFGGRSSTRGTGRPTSTTAAGVSW